MHYGVIVRHPEGGGVPELEFVPVLKNALETMRGIERKGIDGKFQEIDLITSRGLIKQIRPSKRRANLAAAVPMKTQTALRLKAEKEAEAKAKAEKEAEAKAKAEKEAKAKAKAEKEAKAKAKAEKEKISLDK